MKYIIVNERGGINRTSDTAPANLPPNIKAVEVDDAVITNINTMRTNRILPIWLDNALTSTEGLAAQGIRLEWDPKAKQLNKVTIPVVARSISKLAIRRKLREWGKEAAFDALLDTVPHARVDWDDALDLRTDDPLFTTNKEAFKAALSLTNEQFSALISL